MKAIPILVLVWLLSLTLSACSTTTQDTMRVCKMLCRGNVGLYTDDAVSCQCGVKRE